MSKKKYFYDYKFVYNMPSDLFWDNEFFLAGGLWLFLFIGLSVGGFFGGVIFATSFMVIAPLMWRILLTEVELVKVKYEVI